MEKLVNKELIEEIRGNDIKYYYVNFIYEDTNNLLNITNKIFNSNLHGSFHTVRDTVIFFNKIDATFYMNLVKGPATLEEEKYERYGGTPVSEHIYRLNTIDEYQTKLEYIRSYYAEYFNTKHDDVLALKIVYNTKEIGDEQILKNHTINYFAFDNKTLFEGDKNNVFYHNRYRKESLSCDKNQYYAQPEETHRFYKCNCDLPCV
jgi:hypothetical protein